MALHSRRATLEAAGIICHGGALWPEISFLFDQLKTIP
jgi:hypothetical protein